MGGIFEKRTSGSSVTVTEYYQALGRRLAMRQRAPGVSAGSAPIKYLLADHLGSTVGLLDQNGAFVAGSKTSYWPYGGVRSGGSGLPDKGFTGQQQEPGDSALGLYDYGARFYSTTLGRFISADPVVGSAGNPQSWNPYSYVGNNPLRYTDPTGRVLLSEVGGGCNTACQWTSAYNAYHATAWTSVEQHGAGVCSDLCGALLFVRAQQELEQSWVSLSVMGPGPGAELEVATLRCYCAPLVIELGPVDDVLDDVAHKHIVGPVEVWHVAAGATLGYAGVRGALQISRLVKGGGEDTIADTLPFKDIARRSRVQTAIDDIAAGRRTFARDGKIFENAQGRLPSRPLGYYSEHTVVAPSGNRERIVYGIGGERYYTSDHYESFIRIR